MAKVRAEGTTMVEVCSLLFVVSISIVVLYPAQQQVAHRKQQEAFATQCWHNVQELGQEVETWGKTHKGQYPASLTQLKIKTLPSCPAADPTKGNPYLAKDGYVVRNLGETAPVYRALREQLARRSERAQEPAAVRFSRGDAAQQPGLHA